ncbi:MAG: PQQ-binding-like beta-propeller repeat protein [Candidatus Bathyarchaeota archaeon]|nr:PQQ-binding-like beta-propeller repeat protein [Candidatus Bathyarchaeota archaeon]
MKISVNSKFLAIAAIIILTVTVLMTGVSTTTAQAYDLTKQTYAYIGAVPNPVGVNQEVLLHVGITDMLGIETDGWKDLTVTVKDPQGETTTLGPYTTDATGGTGDIFTPTMVGTYELQTHFPEQTYFWSEFPVFIPEFFLKLILYQSSDSEILELEVQQDPIEYYPGHSLPTEYWTRPIDAQLREWYTIGGNWLERTINLYAPYNEYAPETSHILWTKPITTGGLSGGARGPYGMEDGDAYEGKFQDSVIINGMLFYNRYAETFTGPMTPQMGIYAVDLRTGEELWFRNNTKLDFGQTFYFDMFNYHGVFDYLWETTAVFFVGEPETWNAYDPFTGEWVYTMENVPSGPTLRGPNGEILRYIVDLENRWMALWNTTEVVLRGKTSADAGSWGRNVDGRTFDGSLGINWNVTIPADLPGTVLWGLEDRVIGSNETGYWAPNVGDRPITMWGISTAPGKEGDLLFKETWQPPLGDLGLGSSMGMAASVEDGLFTIYCKETRQVWGFDIDTGKKIWGPTESLPYMAQYNIQTHIAEGTLIVNSLYAGVVRAHDVQTGNVLWTYEVEDTQSEILWSKNWPMQTLFITDGKIYIGQTEHSPIDPKPRGAPFIALDMENGEEVFRADGMFRQTDWGGLAIIGDGIIATMDSYDQRIYAIGKGPSEITVSIQDDVIALGSNVLLKGTVMDISAGTEDSAVASRFPAGLPAVADDDMNEWMKYVYKQFPKPADAVGVPVKLEAVDPNNNYQDLGTTTSDVYGNYGFTFEPEVEGQYMIIATFYGSEAYYGSTTTTYLTVDPAPEPYPTDPGYQGPTAQEVAQNVLDNLPDDPTADDIAQEVLDQLPEYPEAPETPEYTTIDLIIIVAIVIVAALVLYTLYIVRKQK